MCLQEAQGDAEGEGVGLPAQAPPQAAQSSSHADDSSSEGSEGDAEPLVKRLHSTKPAAKQGNKAKVSYSH